jgi:hypothetical protein
MPARHGIGKVWADSFVEDVGICSV